MKDISYIAAFPKSGITYLNFMLFHVLFDRPQDASRIDSDYIFDVHESLARVPPPGQESRYLKVHFGYGPAVPLRERANRAVCLVRDPIDVMMSVWDFMHLTGGGGLLNASPAEHETQFNRFCHHWIVTGGLQFPWAGSWVDNVGSWLAAPDFPVLVVRYELLVKQPREQLLRVLKFLGREAPEERVTVAVEMGNVENMRKIESDEISNRVSGIFYRPSMAEGYARGHRFVGRLNRGSAEKVLNPAARQQADLIFGPTLRRVDARAGERS
jgi:hypothetical protein